MGRIPFDPNQSILVIEATLLGKNTDQEFRLKLAFDTGASITTISTDMLAHMGYTLTNHCAKGSIITINGREEVPCLQIRSIKLGSETIENVEVYCHDFPKTRNVDGVLGLNILKHFNCIIDFENADITLHKRKK